MSGAMSQHQFDPSRSIPTADVSVISHEDVLLLAFAYSNKERYSTRTAFFRIMATQYGASISCVSLRHSILAFSAAKLPGVYFRDRHEYHRSQACHTLIQKLQHP